MIELVLAGHDARAIAKAMNMNSHSIALICRSPVFQTELCRRRKESSDASIAALDRGSILGKARSVLEQAATKAAAKHVELLEAENEGLQLKAADKILERVFGKSGDESKTIIHVDADQVNLLNLALKESYNVSDNEQTANGKDANTPQNGQDEELETTESRTIVA